MVGAVEAFECNSFKNIYAKGCGLLCIVALCLAFLLLAPSIPKKVLSVA